MFKGTVNGWTSVADTPIPFNTIKNTNSRISNSAGTLTYNRAGYYNIHSNLVVTGVATDVIATLYVDGVATQNIAEVTLDAVTDFATIPLSDVIEVVRANYPSVGTVDIRLNVAGVTVSGILISEYIQ